MLFRCDAGPRLCLKPSGVFYAGVLSEHQHVLPRYGVDVPYDIMFLRFGFTAVVCECRYVTQCTPGQLFVPCRYHKFVIYIMCTPKV